VGLSPILGGINVVTNRATGIAAVVPPAPGAQIIVGLSIPGLGEGVSIGGGAAHQYQIEARETFTKSIGHHEFRTGVDYIQMRAARGSQTYAVSASVPSIESLRGQPADRY
jgi:hypothetical protein